MFAAFNALHLAFWRVCEIDFPGARIGGPQRTSEFLVGASPNFPVSHSNASGWDPFCSPLMCIKMEKQ